jgi:amino acid permease
MKIGEKLKNYFATSSILAGTILGVGLFGLPYVFSTAGFTIGLLFLVLCCILTTITHLIFGEALLRTSGEHRAPGLARIYLGQKGYYISMVASFISLSGVLLVYLIIGGQFIQDLSQIFSWNIDINLATAIFWLIGILGMMIGIRLIGISEILGVALIIILIFGYLFLGLPGLKIQNFTGFNASNFFLPYGILLFALSGGSAVPEIFSYFKNKGISKEQINFKTPIIWGSVVPTILYLLFVIGAFGLFPGKVIPVDLAGALMNINPILAVATTILGLILILTSYFILGLGFRNILFCDLKLKKTLSWLIPITLPIILFFVQNKGFITIIGFLGAFILAIETVITFIIHYQSQKKGDKTPAYQIKFPIFIRIILITLLLIGAGLEIIKFF